MIELLKNASKALIANDADLLEQLVKQAEGLTASLRGMGAADPAASVGPAAEVLRRQVLAASVQLATRRRMRVASSLQDAPWGR